MNNNPQADELEALLKFDALDTAEKLLGKQDPNVGDLGLQMFMANNVRTAEALAARGDTYFHMTAAQWIACVEGRGFKCVLTDDVAGTQDKLYVFWRPGMLLTMDTYRETRVNSATVYLNWRGWRKDLPSCSNGWICGEGAQSVWDCSLDAREGLCRNLDILEERGEIVSPWVKQSFLWLLDYQEPYVEGYDYKAITAARVSRMPENVQADVHPKAINAS